jgi:hypothetical protein
MIDVRNDMELLVRREIDRRKGARTWGRAPCWCPQCEADVNALALNNLPPRYRRGANFGSVVSEGYGGKVRMAVERAIVKVSQRPKHHPGTSVRNRQEARCEDFALKFGCTIADAAFSAGRMVCSCDGCRADTLALALNHYRPKYGVTSTGRASYQETLAVFIRHEIGLLLSATCQVVSANPHHEQLPVRPPPGR